MIPILINFVLMCCVKTNRNIKSFLKNLSGAFSVEFAILAPIVLMINLVTLEYPIIMFAHSSVQRATFQVSLAARMDSTMLITNDDLNALACNDIAFFLSCTEDSLAVMIIPASRAIGASFDTIVERSDATSRLEKTVIRYRWSPITPFISNLLETNADGDVQLSSTYLAARRPITSQEFNSEIPVLGSATVLTE